MAWRSAASTALRSVPLPGNPGDPGLASGVGMVGGATLTPGASPGPPGSLRDAVEAAERQAIVAALQAAGGNRRAAAKQLGVSLRTLFYKIDRYQLE